MEQDEKSIYINFSLNQLLPNWISYLWGQRCDRDIHASKISTLYSLFKYWIFESWNYIVKKPSKKHKNFIFQNKFSYETYVRNLSTIFTQIFKFNFHFLLSKSGNSFYDVAILFLETFHFFLRESGNFK